MLICMIMFLMISCFVIFFIAYLVGEMMVGEDSMVVFECGFDSLGGGRVPFSLHFFLISIIFVVFDVEIALILPYPLIVEMIEVNDVMAILFIYMFLVLGGLYIEWWSGCLKWVF